MKKEKREVKTLISDKVFSEIQREKKKEIIICIPDVNVISTRKTKINLK